ncbi:lactonase family protein [Gordonia sihwensis]|uniref:lactonase family protein n=1 Tax=Gordonia sihwensis TaxID=173559 RepID=UPI003D984BC0
MRIRVALVTLCVAAASLVGSGSAAGPSMADPPPSGGVSGSKPYNLYTHGFLSSPTVGYRVTDHGPVRKIGGNPVAGMGSWPKTASPDGRHLLVASGVPAVLRNYDIDNVGRLHLRQETPLPDIPVGLEFTPDSKNFYLTMGVANATIQPYRMTDDGSARPLGRRVPVGQPLDGLTTVMVTPNTRHLIVGSYLRHELLRFDIKADRTLTPVRQRVPTQSGPIFPVITPNGRHVYIMNETGNSVSGYNILGDGRLVPTGQAPMPTGLFPHVASVTPDGRFMYVPNLASTFISVFAINSNGTLRALPNAQTGTSPLGPMPESSTLSPSGKVLWTLGQDMARGNECIMQRFFVMPNGTLRHDRSTYVRTGTLISDGKIITMAPGR